MADPDERESGNQGRDVLRDVAEAVREYGSQGEYVSRVTAGADERSEAVDAALRTAFGPVIRTEALEVIDFQALTVMDLARAIESHPLILKPLLAVCNVAGRALERDLDLRNTDTYGPRLTNAQAHAIAGYIKGFLPTELPLAVLTQIDRVSYIDKEIRAQKGRWEKTVDQALNRFSGFPFKKTKFRHGSQLFELDSAYQEGERVLYGVDVKRIEARRDIHKRIDEIVNKAAKLKEAQPEAKFGAVIYYPFTAEHGNIRDRLDSPFIDSIQFAGESQQSVNQAVRLLLGKFGVGAREESP